MQGPVESKYGLSCRHNVDEFMHQVLEHVHDIINTKTAENGLVMRGMITHNTRIKARLTSGQ
jgi:hypothetical protein